MATRKSTAIKDRLEARQDRERAAAAQRKAEDMELLELAWIPDSHKRFREMSVILMRAWMPADDSPRFKNGLGGYRYAPETIEEFKEALEEALQVLAEGRTLFNPDRQAERIAEIRTRGAEKDTDLQRFIREVTEHVGSGSS